MEGRKRNSCINSIDEEKKKVIYNVRFNDSYIIVYGYYSWYLKNMNW